MSDKEITPEMVEEFQQKLAEAWAGHVGPRYGAIAAGLPDPLELRVRKIDRLVDEFVDLNTCMQCGRTFDYEMYCVSPTGDGPAVCVECLGYDPAEKKVGQ